MNKLASILIVILCSLCVHAKNPFIKNYSIEEGLPSNKIYFVYQDSKGFIWFASDAGLIRFDGKNFVRYTESEGLDYNVVTRIKEDTSGRLWLFNRNGTLNYLESDTICNRQNTPLLTELITDYYFRNFYQANDSTLYFYNQMAEVMKVQNNRLTDYKNFQLNNQKDIGLFHLHKSSENKLCLWTARGYYQLNNLDDSPRLHPIPGTLQNVFQTDDHEWIILNHSRALHRYYDNKSIGERLVTSETQLVNSILVDSEGLLWIATYDKGIFCFDGKDQILHLDIEGAQNIIQDRENNMWISSGHNGVFKLSREILKNEHFENSNFDQRGLTKLAPANNGGIWALNGNSLFLIDDTIIRLPLQPVNKVLNYIYQLKNNDILLSGTGSKLFILKNVNKNKYNQDAVPLEMLSTKYRVTNMAIDKTEQTFYSYMANNILVILPQKAYECKVNPLKSGAKINNIFINKRNQVIVNAANNYIIKQDREHDKIKSHFVSHKALNYIRGEIIKSFLPLDDKNEIFNVQGNKLLLHNNDTLYNLTENFVNEIDFRIRHMAYHDSTLFFFTTRTIYYINDPIGIIRGNTPELKRLNIEFRNITDIICNKDNLYIASQDGLTKIPVKDCVNSPVLAPVPFIDKILLDNQVYNQSHEKIELKSKSNLSIEFSSLNFSSYPSNYAYKLDGVDQNWITGDQTKITYHNLPYGKYIFKLKAQKNDEVYSPTIEIPVIIHPRFTELPIFKILSGVLILVILFLIVILFYRRRIKQKETDNMLITLEHKALQSMMNPHFIFNALGSIQVFLLQNKSSEAGTYLSQFARLIRQNMNALKSNFICIDDEIDRLRNYIELERLRLNNKFDYRIEIVNDIDSEETCIPSMIIQPFVENAIWHGVSPISEQGLITIRFNYIDHKSIEVLIEDNGIGIKDGEVTSSAGRGLNMGMELTKKRLKLIGYKYGIKSVVESTNLYPNQNNKGTQIKLIVPLINAN